MDASEFTKRLPPGADEYKTMIEMALGAAAQFRKRASEIRADARYSAQGHGEQIQAAAHKGPLEYMALLRKQVNADAEQLKQRRGELVLKAPDKNDVVAALDRQEVRAWLRSLPSGERVRFALEGDERILNAVINAPAALSGVADEIHARAANVALERKFGPALKTLAQEEEALDVVNAALKVASSQLLNEAGITNQQDDGETK